MATEAKQEGLPDLDDLLQCPVCYEIPTGQIFQCNEGHHVCGRCKARLALCPVCRAFFFGTRNYAMEELIANVRKLQAFKLGGKMTVTSGSGASESTASAENSVAGATLDESVDGDDIEELSNSNLRAPAACKGLFRCLCCKNGSSERLPAARLLNHLRYYHSRDLIEGKTESGEYIQAWQIPTVPGRIVIAVRVVDMGIFFLVFEINQDVIYSWVSMAAAPWVAHEFCYTVTISGNDREAIFTDCVWSVRSCEGALKKRGRCLVVSGADARALTATSNMSGRITLRRAPDDQVAQPAQPRAFVRVANRGTGGTVETAPPPPHSPPNDLNNLEPFLQHLQNDVARLSRAFATLGREANALVRQETQVQSNVRNAARSVNQPTPNNVGIVAQAPDAASAEGSSNENGLMSRNARRRLRKRLRAAINTSTEASTSQNGPAQGRQQHISITPGQQQRPNVPVTQQRPSVPGPQQRAIVSGAQQRPLLAPGPHQQRPIIPAPRPMNLNTSQPPRRAPPSNLSSQAQSPIQQQRSEHPVVFCPLAIVVDNPSGSSEQSQNDNQARNNKKKRRHRR